MSDRSCMKVLLSLCLVIPFLGGCGSSSEIDSIQVSPSTVSIAGISGTAQLRATGIIGHGAHPSTSEDITSTATWTSGSTSIAKVSSSGLVTSTGAGTTTITASIHGFTGVVSASTTVTVTGITTTGGGPAPEPILSLSIIPASITVDQLQDTGQFLAIGTFSNAPFVRDVTNLPSTTWISSVPSVFPVNTNTSGTAGATAGIVTAYGNGSATIIAESSSSDGTIQTATATFNCPEAEANPAGDPPEPATCLPGTQTPALLATLTIYNEGLNNTNWEVTAPSATGTPNVIHCGAGFASSPGGSVCVATYPVGTTVTVTAPANGAAFGGWSYNCAAQGVITAAGPNSCTVFLTTNDTVGAIFN